MNTPHLSFEFFPPKTPKGETKLLATANILKSCNPEFYSVTFGAGGSTRVKTFETVSALNSTGIATAPHVSCIGADKSSIKDMLEEYKSHGIKRIVALRGDKPSGMVSGGDLQYAVELVTYIREEFGDYFWIEVACYPETHPESKYAKDDFKHFAQKIKAGANSAISQYFYNQDAYFYFLDKCAKAQIDIPIIPGIMPITNFERLVQFSSTCGAQLPRWLSQELQDFAHNPESLRQFGLDFVSHMCDNLIAQGAPGLHFYTLNDASASMSIIQKLTEKQNSVTQNISSRTAIA